MTLIKFFGWRFWISIQFSSWCKFTRVLFMICHPESYEGRWACVLAQWAPYGGRIWWAGISAFPSSPCFFRFSKVSLLSISSIYVPCHLCISCHSSGCTLEILAESLVKASYPAMAMMDLFLLHGQGTLGPDQEDPPALCAVSISVTSTRASCFGISWGWFHPDQVFSSCLKVAYGQSHSGHAVLLCASIGVC